MAHLFQEHEGFVSPNALAAISHLLDLSPAVVESTISFYTLLFRRPVGKYMIQVCRNLSCIINGAEEIMAYAREQLGIAHLETTADGLISYEEVECLAACDRAPCAQVNLEFVYDLTRESVDAHDRRHPLGHVRGRAAGADRRARAAPGGSQQDTGRKSAGGVGRGEREQRGRHRRPQRHRHVRPDRRPAAVRGALQRTAACTRPSFARRSRENGQH